MWQAVLLLPLMAYIWRLSKSYLDQNQYKWFDMGGNPWLAACCSAVFRSFNGAFEAILQCLLATKHVLCWDVCDCSGYWVCNSEGTGLYLVRECDSSSAASFNLSHELQLQAAMATALQMVQLLELNSWYAFYLFAQLRFRSTWGCLRSVFSKYHFKSVILSYFLLFFLNKISVWFIWKKKLIYNACHNIHKPSNISPLALHYTITKRFSST